MRKETRFRACLLAGLGCIGWIFVQQIWIDFDQALLPNRWIIIQFWAGVTMFLAGALGLNLSEREMLGRELTRQDALSMCLGLALLVLILVFLWFTRLFMRLDGPHLPTVSFVSAIITTLLAVVALWVVGGHLEDVEKTAKRLT